MNYLDALNYGNKLLSSSDIKNPKLDVELLLSKSLNYTRQEILINLNKIIEKKKFEKFKGLILRRKNKEPIAYILKKKEFWKHNFIVNKGVLIPRPETEIIVDEVLKLTTSNSSKQILDVGTGSGCILLSIIKERPKCHGIAIDICKKAINVAKINAKMHHLENKIKFINIDIDKFSHNKYDFIVSNPPYITDSYIKRLDYDIRYYEPITALKAGFDGLSEIKKLIKQSKTLLKKNGKLIFEISYNQLHEVSKMLYKNSFFINKISKDLQSYPRVIICSKI